MISFESNPQELSHQESNEQEEIQEIQEIQEVEGGNRRNQIFIHHHQYDEEEVVEATEQQQQQQQQQQNTTSSATTTQTSITTSDLLEDETQQRRSSIQLIMSHPNLTNEQRRHSIQILMDGRRRSSFGNTFVEAAQNVAAEFASLAYDNTDDSDSSMSTGSASAADSPPCQTQAVNSLYQTQQQQQQQQQRPPSSPTSTANSTTILLAYSTSTGEPIGNSKLLLQNQIQSNICTHYKRNCSIISPCCGMVFGCRICHDECDNLYIPFMKGFEKSNNMTTTTTTATATTVARKKKNTTTHPTQTSSSSSFFNAQRRSSFNSIVNDIGNDIHHNINRYDIKEIICKKCYTRQSSKTNKCISCNIQFGNYHCSICNLWMDNTKQPYHCHKCGICRIGGQFNFIHCDKCNMCIDKTMITKHNCQAGKFMSNCPVCYEDLFTSRHPCHELPCNHSIHWHCFLELSNVDIRCPICKKTMISNDNNERNELWLGLKEDIESQPLPPDQTRVVNVVCNDCEVSESNRRWHPLGVDCSSCGSFNTALDFTMFGFEAYEFLTELELERIIDDDDDDIPIGEDEIDGRRNG